MEMTENNFVTMLEESIKPLHTGETVTGIVYAITDNEIYLDLGAKFTGVIVKEQITEDASAKLQDMFKVGDEVTAFVIRVEDGKGMATLSKTRVDRDRSWIVLKEAFDNGTDLEGDVTAVVKGGVVMSVAANRDIFLIKKPEEDEERDWNEFLPTLEAALNAFNAALTSGQTLCESGLVEVVTLTKDFPPSVEFWVCHFISI